MIRKKEEERRGERACQQPNSFWGQVAAPQPPNRPFVWASAGGGGGRGEFDIPTRRNEIKIEFKRFCCRYIRTSGEKYVRPFFLGGLGKPKSLSLWVTLTRVENRSREEWGGGKVQKSRSITTKRREFLGKKDACFFPSIFWWEYSI